MPVRVNENVREVSIDCKKMENFNEGRREEARETGRKTYIQYIHRQIYLIQKDTCR